MYTREELLQMIKEHLPSPGTELSEFRFLAPEALRTGETEGQPFVVVAEDIWPCSDGICGMFLMVRADGSVWVADLENNDLVDYCAAGFPQFMKIMELYQAALETTPVPDVFDDESYEKCEGAQRMLRQQIMEIDPTAIADENGLWSTRIEEMEVGM